MKIKRWEHVMSIMAMLIVLGWCVALSIAVNILAGGSLFFCSLGGFFYCYKLGRSIEEEKHAQRKYKICVKCGKPLIKHQRVSYCPYRGD